MFPMLRLILLGLLIVLVPGCIQRSVKINSNPQGALVYLNDEEVGRTPTTVPFTFYGVYDVRLEMDGYQTLSTSQKASAPWFDNPGPDLVTELLPWRTNVQLEWFFDLQPLQPVDEALTIERARELRAQVLDEAPSASADESNTPASPDQQGSAQNDETAPAPAPIPAPSDAPAPSQADAPASSD